MLNSLLKRTLGLERTVVEGARIEGDSIIVSVRPRRAAPRRPVCGRRCVAYDRLRPRRWRAPGLGASCCYLEHAPAGSWQLRRRVGRIVSQVFRGCDAAGIDYGRHKSRYET